MTVTLTPTSAPRTARRPSPAARRFGYLVAAIVDAVMLYAINRWPGWEELSFLTAETDEVLLAVNASIVVGLLVNLGYLAYDPQWLRGLGDMVTTAFSLVAIVRIWTVFPFSFDGSGIDWETITRWLLALGIAGTAIGFVAGLVALLRNRDRDEARG